MRIVLNPGQIIAGPDVVPVGDGSHDVPDRAGAALVKAGHAEPVKPEKPADEQPKA